MRLRFYTLVAQTFGETNYLRLKRFLYKVKTLISRSLDVLEILVEISRVMVNSNGKSRNLIVGDSHSPFLAGNQLKRFYRGEENFYCLYLGPRLLHSVATKGFPSLAFVMLSHLHWNSVIFILGEIDVRVFLANKERSFRVSDQVAASYLTECVRISEVLKSKSVMVLAPVPPSNLGKENLRFPRNGSLQARVKAFNDLNALLDKNCRKYSVPFIDTRKILTNSSGSLKKKLTNDGCHLNSRGSSLVREHLLTLLKI